MEKLIGFVVHVFENVWRKFKINPAIILTVSIILAALFLLGTMKFFPLFSTYDIIIKTVLAVMFFILAKICVVTVGEIKINSETLHIVLFQNLANPLALCIVFAIILGTAAFICALPFVFLDLDEKFYIVVGAAAAGIAAFVLFPLAATSLLFAYEGKSPFEAVSSAQDILKGRRGRMYFLTFSLILIALFLKITYVGMIILFPLVIMVLAQARESLVKSEEEDKDEKIEVKKSYRPGIDYSQSNNVNRRLAPERKENAFVQKDAAGSAETFKISNGQKSVTVEIEATETEKKTSRIVSAAEYEAPKSEEEDLVELMKGDILYENEREEKIEVEVEKNDKDEEIEENNEDVDPDIEHEIEIEIEKDIKDKKIEHKSGKVYLEDFGIITRGDVKPKRDKEISKSGGNGNYLDNFGNLKRRK